MVNHSAIEQNEPNSSTTHTNDGCPRTNNTKHIVTAKTKIFIHLLTFIRYRKVLSFGQKIFKVSS